LTEVYPWIVDKRATNFGESEVRKMGGAQLLDVYFTESGKSKQHLCHKLMVSRPRLDKILREPSTATVGQANTLRNELNISSKRDFESIFLPTE
jgi:hypothetical protein